MNMRHDLNLGARDCLPPSHYARPSLESDADLVHLWACKEPWCRDQRMRLVAAWRLWWRAYAANHRGYAAVG
jgi:hypothetical protein